MFQSSCFATFASHKMIRWRTAHGLQKKRIPAISPVRRSSRCPGADVAADASRQLQRRNTADRDGRGFSISAPSGRRWRRQICCHAKLTGQLPPGRQHSTGITAGRAVAAAAVAGAATGTAAAAVPGWTAAGTLGGVAGSGRHIRGAFLLSPEPLCGNSLPRMFLMRWYSFNSRYVS